MHTVPPIPRPHRLSGMFCYALHANVAFGIQRNSKRPRHMDNTAVCRIECSPVLRDFEHATAVGQSDAPLKGHERSGRSCMGPWRRPAAHVPEISRHETAFYSANGCISSHLGKLLLLLTITGHQEHAPPTRPQLCSHDSYTKPNRRNTKIYCLCRLSPC